MKRPPFFLFRLSYQIIVFLILIIIITTTTSVFAEVPGGVRGFLKDPDGSMPIQYGWVEIKNVEGEPWMGTDTDSNGFFSISNLPPENYILTAYPPEDSEYSTSVPVEVEVISGEFTEFIITPIYLTYTRISGRVQDSDTGNPIEGASVVAHDEEWTIERWAVTDINGNFKIGGVEIGVTYILEVFEPPGTDYVQLPIEYTATPIETGKVLEMRIVPINIIGTVKNPEGGRVPKARVIVNREDYWMEINADESGDFVFRGLPAGEFQLHARPPWGIEGLIESESIIVNIATSDSLVEVGVITLPFANKRVIGRVIFQGTDNGVSDAIVWAERLDEPRSADTPTDSEGNFELSLTGGEWHLAVEPLFSPAAWIFPGPPVFVYFELNPEPEPKEINLEVVPTNAEVIGRIVCPGGQPCENEPSYHAIRIEIRNDEIGNSTELNPEYGFILPVPDGRYEMIVHIEHPEAQGPRLWPVDVSPGETLDMGDIALLLKDASIKGRVSDESGDGIPGVFVATWQPEGFGDGFAETNSNGDYSIQVIGGEWLVEPRPGPELPYVMRGPASFISVAPGGTMEHIDFVLTSAEARVTGTAIDAKTGEPVCEVEGEARAEQIISPEEAGFFSSAPFRECGFEIKVQGNKKYNISLELPFYEPYVSGSTGPILVPEGGIINVQIPLMPKDAVIEGQLKDASTGEPLAGPIQAELYGEDDHGHWVSTMTNPEIAGYSLGVVSGNWHLHLSLSPDSGYVVENPVIHLTIEPEQVLRRDFYLLPINSYISGKVTGPEGIMPVQAFVLVEGESPFTGYFETSVESDPAGNFELVVPEGNYIVRATLPPEELKERGWLNPPPIAEVTVSAGSPVTDLELLFRVLDGEISGKITFAPDIVVNPTHPAYVWGRTESGERTETEAIISEMYPKTFEYVLPVIKNVVWYVGAIYEDQENGYFYESPEVPVPVLPTTGLAKKDLVLGGPWPLPQPFIVSFDGTQMQTIILPDGVEIKIPPGALVNSVHSQTVTLYIFPTKEVPPQEGKRLIGTAYEIWAVDENGQEITQFYKNVVMIFHYPPDQDLAQLGISEYQLIPFYYSTLVGHWIPANNYVVDTFHNEITLQLSYFARIAVMANEIIEYQESDLDLSVLEFEMPDTVDPNQVLTEGLSLHIENIGTSDSKELSIGIYLSEDPVISPDDILLTDGQQSVSGLDAGSSMDVNLSDWMIRIPANISEGPYYIGALLDNYGDIREKEEENNSAAIPIKVGATSGQANLYVISFKGPSSASTGQAIGSSISLKIGNNGQTNAGQFSVGVYLLQILQPPPWPVNQLLAGGRKTVYSLLPGATVQIPFDSSVSIPTGIPPGSYYIGVLIDDTEQVTETFESDNYKSNVIGIKAADLYIESFSSKLYSAAPGQSMINNIKVRVGNKGQGDGGHSYNLGIYLSTDSIITSSDLLLSKGMVYLASLPSGAFVDIPFDQGMSIPTGIAQSSIYHYIGVLVDVYDNEDEENENNNYKSSPFRVTTDTWTVMAYLDGDCNREWQALDSLDQMEEVNQAGVPINLVALVDRHPNNPSGYKGGYSGDKVPSDGTAWSDTRWGPVIYDGIRESFATDMTPFDPNHPELNVADGKTLASFILKMMEVAPAQHYAIVIYDHGSMGGIAEDDTSNDGGITMSELKAAFDAVPHIDIVVLDACLMQDVEVATEMIGEVEYVMASQSERGAGLINLDKSLKWLQTNYNATPAQLAQRLFMEDHHDTGMSSSKKGCVSVINMNEVGKLNQLIDIFATTALENATQAHWVMLRDARSGVDAFAWNSYLDLKQYMQNIVNNTNIPSSFRSRAQNVISQVNKVVVHQKGYGTGITINLPENNTKIHPGYNGNTYTFVDTSDLHGTHWRDFLDHLPSNVYTVVLGDLSSIDWGDFIIQARNIEANPEQPVFLESMISPETKYGPDVDFFRFTPSPGQVLYADVFGNPANGGLMPVITVYAPDMDTVLAQEIADENGVASIRSLNLPYQEGTYYLAVTSTGNLDPLQPAEGDTMGTYSLSMIFGEPEALIPRIEVQPSSISFGDIEIDTWGVKTITLTNTGGTLLEISSFELSQGMESPFRAPDSPIIMPINLGPGESFSLSIGANPLETGMINDILRIVSTDPNHPGYEVYLEAEGIEPSADEDFEMDLSAGWSMISLPVITPDAKLSELFPEAAVMYRFERGAGYVRVQANEELQVGTGYWILVYEDQNYVLTGQPIPYYNKTVYSSGWEMIGGCTSASGARPTAYDCEIGVIYRFERGAGYRRVLLDSENMESGKGFWILFKGVEDQCELTVEPDS
ncbi:MAG: carboxypeptidase regulatory-like domain-containing protein [bacterium]